MLTPSSNDTSKSAFDAIADYHWQKNGAKTVSVAEHDPIRSRTNGGVLFRQHYRCGEVEKTGCLARLVRDFTQKGVEMLQEKLKEEHNHIPKKRPRVSEEQRQHAKEMLRHDMKPAQVQLHLTRAYPDSQILTKSNLRSMK